MSGTLVPAHLFLPMKDKSKKDSARESFYLLVIIMLYER